MKRQGLMLLAFCADMIAASPSTLAAVRIEGQLIVPPVVVAPAPPPPLRPERVPAPPPGPPGAIIWAPGHWEWSGRSYFWVGGHYVERPEIGLLWEPGRWAHRHGHWEWLGGHWRR